MEIVNLFYNLARECKYFEGFVYGNTHQKGAGMEAHPLMWMDDPINARSVVNNNSNIMYQTVNIDMLDIPTSDVDIANIQANALEAGLAVIEKIKQTRFSTGYNIDSFFWISLRNYYDNNAAGIRFTIILTSVNPLNLCSNYFDENKQFQTLEVLPNFGVDHPDGCAIFNDGLPQFTIKD